MSIIVITGCSSGFGFESALAFARRGDTVYATVRDLKKAQPLSHVANTEELDIRVKILDVTRPEMFDSFFQEISDESERIDVLVNNAGILRAGALEDLSEHDVREVMETNCMGPLLLTRAVLPFMREQNQGHIITISSLSGIAGLPGDVAYTASKFALEGGMEALRHEVDRWGIKLALVQGGLYATRIFDANLNDEDPNLPRDYSEQSPYKPLIESKYKEFVERLPDAASPSIIAELLLKIADSDGQQFRWPADEIAVKVLGTMFAQTDSERDAFLRMVSNSDWWSEGKDRP